MIINGNLKFHTLGSGELQNAVMENMTTGVRDAIGSPADGQLIFNTTTSQYNFYNGTIWTVFATGGDASLLEDEINAIELASGGIFDSVGEYDGTTVDTALGNVTTSTDLLNALTQLDAAISTAAGVDTLAELTDVTLTTPASTELLQYNGSQWVNVAATSIGEFGFKTISGDSGSAIADELGDTLGLVGASAAGITTIGEDTGDTVSFALTPTDLSTTSATLVGADFLIVSDSADASTVAGQKTSITKLINDLDIVTATANGILARTADDTYASRTLTASVVAGDEGLSIVNGNGISGNPTIGLDIVGLTAEAGTPSATDTLALYDGTNNVKVNITQLNAALTAVGTSIDDLTDVTITAAANNEFLVFNGSQWVDTTAADARTAMDVYSTGTADSTFVDIAGDTMTDDLNMGGSNIVTGLAAPSSPTDATNKLYVDNLIAGMSWKNPVVAATTTNINLGTGTLLTIDGITVSAADRVLVKDQTLPAENGIYVAATGAWIRVTDMDSTSPIDEFNGAATFVLGGTASADIAYNMTSAVSTVGTDAVTWVPFSGTSAIVDGVGLVLTGNVLDVQLGAGIAALPSDEVGVDLFTDGGLRLSDTVGGAASVLTGAKLRLLIDGTTLSMSATGVKVPSGGITAVEVNSSIAGDGLEGGSGTALSLDLKAASGVVIDTGELSLSGIPNTALTNNSLTLAADTGSSEDAALGETLTIAGGTGIDTVVSATNTVTAALNATISLLTDVDTSGAALGNTLVWNNTNWVPGNPINSSDELTDVTAAATVAGQVLVSDGTDYTPVQIQHVSTQASATTWTVTHSLNQKFVNVTVYDSSFNMIIPQSVVATSTSVTTITFNTAIAGTAVVMGVAGLAAV